MEILVQNKQRQHKIATNKLEICFQQLANAVFENLQKDKPKVIWSKFLKNLQHASLVSVVIVSPVKIRQLNKMWRSKNKETDVLSFPLLGFAEPEIKEELTALEAAGAFRLENSFEIGEIFISYEQALVQAKEYGHNIHREMAFLFVHGLLHILGFDHQTKEEEKNMFTRQKKVLDELGFLR